MVICGWRRAGRAGVGVVLVLACGLAPLGCFWGGGGPREMKKEGRGYDGPPIAIDSTAGGGGEGAGAVGEQHMLVLTAPSAGWSFMLDTVRESYKQREVFVTVVGPNPAYSYAPGPVEQHLGTAVESRVPITVYARVLEYAEKAEGQGYGLVTGSP